MYSKYSEVKDACERWNFAHAAYNAGRGNVNKAERLELLEDGSCQTWKEAAKHLIRVTGQANAKQTIDYVDRINRFFLETATRPK